MSSERIYEAILDETSSVVYLSDVETYQLIYLNKAARRIFRRSITDQSYIGEKCYKVLQGLDAPCSFCSNCKLTAEQDFYHWEHYNNYLNRYYSVKDKLLNLDGRLVRMEIATDITEKELERKKLENELLVDKALIECVKLLSGNGDYYTAIQGLLKNICEFYQGDRSYIFEIDYQNQRFFNLYEWHGEEVSSEIGNLQNIPLEDLKRWMEAFSQSKVISIESVSDLDQNTAEYKALSSQDIENLIAVPLMDDGVIVGFIGIDNAGRNSTDFSLLQSVTYFIISDIKKRMMLRKLNQASTEDPLSQVYNRRKYMKDLKKMEDDSQETFGVVLVDLNGLRIVNETFGHDYGDSAIRMVAKLLKDVFGDVVYRIGGDEFVCLCEGIDKQTFEYYVKRLRSRAVENKDVSISIGSTWTDRHTEFTSLVMYADELMYLDKQSYYKDITVNYNHNSEIARTLLTDIRDKKYLLYLQPIVRLVDGETVYAEALIRKMDECGQLVSPKKFIQKYESGHIIRHLDFFVLKSTCRLLREWKDQGLTPVKISVNMSRITLMEESIIRKIMTILKQWEIEPSEIHLEVTESGEREGLTRVIENINKLGQCGFTISIDDFGTEYSNFMILSKLDFNQLKLDKSLVDHVEANYKSRLIVDYTIKLCKDIKGVTTVAEGIENQRQMQIMKEAGCDYGQGYYFSGPLPASEFEIRYLRG